MAVPQQQETRLDIDRNLLDYPRELDKLATSYSRGEPSFDTMLERLADKLKSGVKVTVLFNGKRILLYLDKNTKKVIAKSLDEYLQR